MLKLYFFLSVAEPSLAEAASLAAMQEIRIQAPSSSSQSDEGKKKSHLGR
jgi:hypothetical protein